MKVAAHKEDILKGQVRDIIAINPLVSIRRMQELVENNTGRKLSDKYTAKLMYKVRREAVVQSDRKKLNDRLAEVRERHRVLIRDLSRSIYWKPEYLLEHGIQQPSFKEQLAAMKLQAHLEVSLFKAEIAAGMFEDRRTAIEDMLKEGILPTEIREQIITIFRERTFRSFIKTEQEMGVIPKNA